MPEPHVASILCSSPPSIDDPNPSQTASSPTANPVQTDDGSNNTNKEGNENSKKNIYKIITRETMLPPKFALNTNYISANLVVLAETAHSPTRRSVSTTDSLDKTQNMAAP
ncbi:hypothetical protein Pcinc_016636 [Petrolisthes cinctipes]|uniref:Uncharacterized protein n=1 Tax=Petrolisthes cinctipes TaxID=88211 RepID=A0AAE1KPE4_PETCI|nr:hypothetical protein Pcinc_016636 [Petrolisthes cinctipes]